eukprot:TRINITY_DN53940_c0_g1_i1.p1 TRINITY_DN53940_c0_g1~~TRINITY_DN53940_c0_g1_i1.p1  ORF type:complete len:1309 (-),score=272.18 TRINITY_DN53940_c0_g1_i1:634-4497(-)
MAGRIAAASHTKGREGKSIEEIYQKKTQLEHILLRPDTYVGSIEAQAQELWVFDSVQSRMVHRKVTYVPALYKIFDEILVNAADNLMRDPEGMDTIKVEIDPKAGTISVMNNGRGLPVVIHKEHKVYVPEMVFGHLLTSDNYNDGDCKVVGGRNGYGAKLANVFSLEFTVETCDGSKKYSQTWLNNMSTKKDPKVVPSKEASFTKVTFKPDLARLGMDKLDDDIVSLLTKRVYDVAGSTMEKCVVYLNGEKLDVSNFREYTDLYLLTRQGVPQIFERCGERWEVCVSLTESGFQQVSFVNSICTIRGGTHVNHVADQLVEVIVEKVRAQSKEKVKGGVDVKPHHVKSHLWVFVKCLIENPAFDSQTKETLTTKQSKFGSRCELSDKFLDEVSNCGIVDLILMSALAKSKVALGKNLKANTGKVSRLTGVPKLEDANDAGGKNSRECTLILTEGDSAKALAVAGLSIVGRDRFGVFPLRGKVLNVRDATLHQMMANTEIQNLIKIMALDFNREYDAELKGLRYGSIMIMTDQDHDGSHIKGLLINLIHAWWPSLAKLPGFLKEFFTPIVKVHKGKLNKAFYTLPEYEEWKRETQNGQGWRIKYYKGLGTSTAKEAKEYFSNIESHKLSYKYEGVEDDRAIDLAFNKKRADDRKEWVNGVVEGNLVDHSQPEVTYCDFINKELVLFSRANVVRAIPNIMDGFKPSQRKVLFGCFKRKLKNDCKVAQLTGYVSEQAAYHHGETSLQDTIVGMAQDFVGSNNINLLVPQGQFGTRLQGGKDAASARYIYTRLSPITRVIFQEADDNVLNFLDEEGMSIEPTYYCPVLPMVLVNGCDGIGTGYATSVPNYNPSDIIANLRRFIKNQKLEKMAPWYHGFKGSIEEAREDGKYEVCGLAEYHGENKAEITELPIKKWTQDYREFLEECLPKGAKKEGSKFLEEFTEHHTEKNIHFELSLSADGVKAAEAGNLEKILKLKTSLSTNNMILFDSEGKIRKYETAEDIVRDFAVTRLEMYGKRKEFLVNKLTFECEVLNAKVRFIKLVISGELVIKRRKIADLIAELRRRGFKALREMKGYNASKGKSGAAAGEDDAAEDDNDDEHDEGEDDEEGAADGEAGTKGSEAVEESGAEASANASASSGGKAKSAAAQLRAAIKDFEYLVGMPISTLTAERIAELNKLNDTKTTELTALKKKTIQAMWLDDLDDLEKALKERDAKLEEEERKEAAKLQKARAKAAKGSAAAPKGQRGVKRSASEPAVERSASAPARKRTAPADEEGDDAAASRPRGRARKA